MEISVFFLPQMLAVAPCPSPSSSEELVMVTDSVSGENLVFSVATPTGTPPFVSCATHTVARYRYVHLLMNFQQ